MKWMSRPIGDACLVSTLSSNSMECNHLDVIYDKVDKVKDSRRTRILTMVTAMD